ncbi:MAG: 3-deoxy-D-manno-octulosonic acid transferase [Methylocystis sp.]|nr:3-deoxy-D-manno-octulosonic acid transferase [Methylocystis sp.]MCA3582372.1 3-deoxy-D-manno-octulosonic acid transferase [Methylocystis sp.]MCA3588267.1 3-deoxy-D-manno-octulosonic acid transferase [Methylocystis sp.]MCA3590185.1 3-deoxy-D-manno-octulosonic acid transferase [Methylocystis sp.]
MGKRPFSVKAYAGMSRLLYPAAGPLLSSRRRRGKEDPARVGERKGIAGLPRPEGVLVWLHGASVGEVLSLVPIAEHFMAAGVAVLVTSGTVTSAELARRRLPQGAIHQYVPLDLPAYVRRFLAHWRPDIGVFAESELWPNLVHAAQEGGAHLVIVNARMSERSFARWRKLPAFAASLLSRFELVLAQSEADAERLRLLGAPRVQAIGNIKYDVTPPPADAEKLAALTAALQGRPVFVAASTHPGEEEQLAEAYAQAKPRVPGLLMVVAPRHPERGKDVANLFGSAGLAVRRRSEGALPAAADDVYVADTIGELGLFYRRTGVTYLGGSLVPHGGQNPIEPAKLGNAILHGPYVHNFTEVFDGLRESGGARQVANAAELAEALAALLTDEAGASAMAEAARARVEAMAGANQRAIAALQPFLVQAQLGQGA